MKSRKLLLFGGILLLGIGFAAVSTTLYINGNVNISANTEDFDVKFTRALIDDEDKTSESISVDGKTINFTTKELQALNDKSVLDFEITNNSSLYDAEVSIECTRGERGDYYQITKEVANTIPSKTTDKGKVEVEKIRMSTGDIEEEFTCTLTAIAKERTIKGEEKVKINKNIVNKDVECLKDKEAGSCTPGTEIRYMVNDRDEKTFYVLHDDGNTMTLQQRENTVEGVAWYADANDNTQGPLTALIALEDATSGWSNVNVMQYTMGTTNFNGTNAYTGCEKNLSCTINMYTLNERSSRARMITVQEVAALGCTESAGSCPSWINDYLNNSIAHGGTVNGSSDGYWTMSVNTSDKYYAFYVNYCGYVPRYDVTKIDNGARAVIEINKYV